MIDVFSHIPLGTSLFSLGFEVCHHELLTLIFTLVQNHWVKDIKSRSCPTCHVINETWAKCTNNLPKVMGGPGVGTDLLRPHTERQHNSQILNINQSDDIQVIQSYCRMLNNVPLEKIVHFYPLTWWEWEIKDFALKYWEREMRHFEKFCNLFL